MTEIRKTLIEVWLKVGTYANEKKKHLEYNISKIF